MSSLNRREFIKDSAVLAALAAAGGFGKADRRRQIGKRRKVRRRRQPAARRRHRRPRPRQGPRQRFRRQHNCVVTTICDADSDVIGDAMKSAEKAQGVTPKYEQDIRKVVEDKNIDVISIATPNHWHSLAAIWGLQNGKNVYVEKPVSHNVSEGRRVVEVARKQKLLCQAGTQSRSSPGTASRRCSSSTTASSARSPWPAASATSRAAASARSAARRNRPRRSITTSGAARPPSSR